MSYGTGYNIIFISAWQCGHSKSKQACVCALTEFAKEFTVAFEIGSEYLGNTENVLTVGYGIEDFMAKMFAKENNFLSML